MRRWHHIIIACSRSKNSRLTGHTCPQENIDCEQVARICNTDAADFLGKMASGRRYTAQWPCAPVNNERCSDTLTEFRSS